jgi:hypothetical protein
MSIDNPNEYEQVIEAYGAAVRRQREADRAFVTAQKDADAALLDRQAKWRKVTAFVIEGKIEPGIYRLNKGPGQHADGVLIEPHHDYPELFPMFR